MQTHNQFPTRDINIHISSTKVIEIFYSNGIFVEWNGALELQMFRLTASNIQLICKESKDAMA